MSLAKIEILKEMHSQVPFTTISAITCCSLAGIDSGLQPAVSFTPLLISKRMSGGLAKSASSVSRQTLSAPFSRTRDFLETVLYRLGMFQGAAGQWHARECKQHSWTMRASATACGVGLSM